MHGLAMPPRCALLLAAVVLVGQVQVQVPALRATEDEEVKGEEVKETETEMDATNTTQNPTKPCKDAAGAMVWDKYCAWKAKAIPAPPAGLWTRGQGKLGKDWMTRGGVDASVGAEVATLKTTCKVDKNKKFLAKDLLAPAGWPRGLKTPQEEMARFMAYWFKHEDKMCLDDIKLYFGKEPGLDCALHDQFHELHDMAITGKLDLWACVTDDPLYLVALTVLLDQLTRNLGRRGNGESPKPNGCGTTANNQMYSGDAKAQAIALFALESNKYAAIPSLYKQFIHLVFTHSENIGLQALCNTLTTASLASYTFTSADLAKCKVDRSQKTAQTPAHQYKTTFDNLWSGIAAKHYFVMDSWGRQPHRNKYAVANYYSKTRGGLGTNAGWFPIANKEVRTNNAGKFAIAGDAEPKAQRRGTPQPIGRAWTTPGKGCSALTGEVAFHNAAPLQFNDKGLPSAGDGGPIYNAACTKKQKGRNGALLEEGELHWLD